MQKKKQLHRVFFRGIEPCYSHFSMNIQLSRLNPFKKWAGNVEMNCSIVWKYFELKYVVFKCEKKETRIHSEIRTIEKV